MIGTTISGDNDRDNDCDNDGRSVDDYGDDYGLRGEAEQSSTVLVARTRRPKRFENGNANEQRRQGIAALQILSGKGDGSWQWRAPILWRREYGLCVR